MVTGADSTGQLSPRYYAAQSQVTDPGNFTARVLQVPATLPAMRRAAQQLVFHYRGGGDFAENGIAAERIGEIDTRYARDMLARIFELSDLPLTAQRSPRQRIVGCCRDFTVLFLAIARAHGMPARARVGFGAYLDADWNLDHAIAEVWDAAEGRWRFVDPQLSDDHTDPSTGAQVDPQDLTGAQFLTGAAAWLACRSGAADPERFIVGTDFGQPWAKGWSWLRHNLVLDLAALARHEMVLWDNWGLGELGTEPGPLQLAALDDVAAAISSSYVSPATVQALFERDGLRLPPVVSSWSPASEVPLLVQPRA
jgi:transglutaminase-like putative cysteine protease